MSNYILSTTDNPWNPYTDFDAWYAWDVSHGYCTCSYLDRVSNTSPDLPDATNDAIIAEAMDDIVKLDLIALVTDGRVHYKKVYLSTDT